MKKKTIFAVVVIGVVLSSYFINNGRLCVVNTCKKSTNIKSSTNE